MLKKLGVLLMCEFTWEEWLFKAKLPEHERIPLIDRIVRICSALINLCPPIVLFN